MTESTPESSTSIKDRVVWILVDHSARAEAFATVAEALGTEGVHVEIVTITEVIGSLAKDVLTGGAERLLRGLRVAFQGRSSDEDLIGAVRRAKPDVLAITQARYVRALSLLESLSGIPSLQLGVVPDYNLDESWLRSGLHAFIVPHQEMVERLHQAGVLAERVLVAGPAIQRGFTQSLQMEAERDTFGFSNHESILLVRADGFAIPTLEKLVFQAKLVEGKVRFLFHHNGDGSVANALRRAASEYGLPAAMFGRVHDLERYVASSDAVILSPQDPLMAEVLAQGKPVFMIGPDDHASSQVAFLERHKMGRHVRDLLRVGSDLEAFIRPDALEKYREGAQAIGQPHGSQEVAKAIGEAIRHAEAWRSNPNQPAPQSPQNTPEQDQGTGGGTGGAFESIGAGGAGGAQGKKDSGGGNEYSGISQAEAKEQMAQLILVERDLERRLGDLEKEQQRWRSRLDLAREWGEGDLATEAEGLLRGYLQEGRALQEEIQGVRRQKDKLKAAAQGKSSSAATGGAQVSSADQSRILERERRFRKMEEDRDLGDLKDRLRREFGDD